jgi:Zn-dependent protease/CBS domain-containing protein
MFGRGITLFKLFGFEVRLDGSWFIIAILVTWSLARGAFPSHYEGLSKETYWIMGAIGMLGLFASIVLHELGHAYVAQKQGIAMRGITLFIFGGVAEMGEQPPSPKAEFWMAIAGPIVTVVIAAVCFGVAHIGKVAGWPIPVTGVLSYLAWINVVLLAFNLVPAFPLDGGRVLRSILWAIKKNLRWATRVASLIGTGFAFLLMAWGIFSFIFNNFIMGVWYFLIGMFIRNASQMSYQQVLMRSALAGVPVRRFMTAQPVTVPASTSLKDVVENYLYKYPYKLYPVVQNENLAGCLSIDQIKLIPKEQWASRTAESVAMPCAPENVIEPEADATKALSTMSRTHSSRLMVVDHGHLLGIIAFKDLALFLSRKMELDTI